MSTERCPWASNEGLIRYHDQEWGVPLHNDRGLFEFIILEGAQAGLSWDTILKKRERYREVFDDFDAAKIARYTPRKVESILKDAGIVRNRLKVESAIDNARAFLEIQRSHGTFDRFVWSFVGGTPIDSKCRARGDVPVSTEVSDALSKALKRVGMRFVGTTICYAFMQATGMVNDHLVTCPRHAAVNRLLQAKKRR